MVKRKRLRKVLLIGTIIMSGFFVFSSFQGQCLAKEYTIHLHGAAQGTSGHVITFAWADLINKHSSWLKTTVSEELAPGVAVPLFVMKPEIRKTDVMFAVSGNPQGWSMGRPPLSPKKPYDSWVMICRTLTAPGITVTLDPNIKTIHDLKGKRLACLPRMSPPGMAMVNFIKHGAELEGKIKVDFLGPPAAKDALLSGLVDAALFPFGSDAPTWMVPGFAVEIFSTKKAGFVDLTKEVIDKTYKKITWPVIPHLYVPEGTYLPNQKPFWAYGIDNYYACDRELPDDVVYEMLRVMYDHVDQFKGYHAMGRAVSREMMGRIDVPAEKIHPAAIKFFKEKGIKCGWFER
jgi:TRAP transporter TAXI family solute receptor